MFKTWGRLMTTDFLTLVFALRDRRVSPGAKVVTMLSILYLFSPIDIIPDVIPFAGIIDDIAIVPLGFMLAERFITPEIMAEHRLRATTLKQRAVRYALLAFVLAAWIAVLAALVWRMP